MHTLPKTTIALISLVLFLFTFGLIAAGNATEATLKVSGTVLAVAPEIGKLAIEQASGEKMTLMAGPDIDLKTCAVGDKVTVECDGDRVILSLVREPAQ